MEVHVLASGSKGNSTYIKINNKHILIDVGISFSRLNDELKKRNIDYLDIDTILITHEHTDHICGLQTFLKRNPVKNLLLTEGTHQKLKTVINGCPATIIKADYPIYIDSIEILPVMTFHDAIEPVGFIIKSETKKMAYITDTGYIHESYYALMKDLDLYIIEANHEPFMLMNSDRPFLLKKRILGDKGHLSNLDAIYAINATVDSKKTTWIIAHISEECNSILEIEKAIVKNLKKPDLIDIYFATQKGLKGIKI